MMSPILVAIVLFLLPASSARAIVTSEINPALVDLSTGDGKRTTLKPRQAAVIASNLNGAGYLKNLDICQTLCATSLTRLHINFTDFNLTDEDSFSASDPVSASTSVCNASRSCLNRTLLSAGPCLRLCFHTNAEGSGRGFDAYAIQVPACPMRNATVILSPDNPLSLIVDEDPGKASAGCVQLLEMRALHGKIVCTADGLRHVGDGNLRIWDSLGGRITGSGERASYRPAIVDWLRLQVHFPVGSPAPTYSLSCAWHYNATASPPTALPVHSGGDMPPEIIALAVAAAVLLLIFGGAIAILAKLLRSFIRRARKRPGQSMEMLPTVALIPEPPQAPAAHNSEELSQSPTDAIPPPPQRSCPSTPVYGGAFPWVSRPGPPSSNYAAANSAYSDIPPPEALRLPRAYSEPELPRRAAQAPPAKATASLAP